MTLKGLDNIIANFIFLKNQILYDELNNEQTKISIFTGRGKGLTKKIC